MSSECAYSFWDLYKAAEGKEADTEFRTKFSQLSQGKRNILVRKWSKKLAGAQKTELALMVKYILLSVVNLKKMTSNIDLTTKKCVPCEGGMPSLVPEEVENLKKQISDDWNILDYKLVTKKFKFKTFKDSIAFTNKIADLAEKEGHHPDIAINYNRVTITLTTHAVKGLSENDFIMAAKIDKLTE